MGPEGGEWDREFCKKKNKPGVNVSRSEREYHSVSRWEAFIQETSDLIPQDGLQTDDCLEHVCYVPKENVGN